MLTKLSSERIEWSAYTTVISYIFQHPHTGRSSIIASYCRIRCDNLLTELICGCMMKL